MRIRSPRTHPRRGGCQDIPYREFVRQRGCILAGKHICRGYVTVHHVRFCGSPKDDHTVLGMCQAAHLHDFGANSIERLGKRKFEAHWSVDLNAEIAKNQRAWEELHE